MPDGVGFNATPRPLYPRERDLIPTVQGAGWAPGLILMGAGSLASDCTARCESLYQLQCSSPSLIMVVQKIEYYEVKKDFNTSSYVYFGGSF